MLFSPFFWMYLSWTWVFWPWAAAIAISAYGLYNLSRHLKGEAMLAEQLAIVTSTLTWLTLVPLAHVNGGGVRCGLREADRHLEVIVKSRSLSRSDRCSFDRFFSFGGRRADSTRCICGAGSPVAVVADPGDSSASLISSVPFCHLSFHLLLWIRVALEMDLGRGCLLSHGGRVKLRPSHSPSEYFFARWINFSFLNKSEGSLLQQDRTQARFWKSLLQ
ncbi:hypothetical protein SASPL_123544 [Salvia splendens]|uniref:Uncharacterized protein n=1 Tax=Salvia splendens TaxID=180675 RepID=A0A8X8XQ18_SALSN|nr:hypothetical protein SASPL_123544 [Salvia splendens]